MFQSGKDIEANFTNETDSDGGLKFDFAIYRSKIQWKLNQKKKGVPALTEQQPLAAKKTISRGRPKLSITKCSHKSSKHYA
tara:strand:- start:222 stop:464 length:243 start_codon:yes stop_codon:yes gene_type:complete